MTSDHAPAGKGDYNVIRIWGVDSNRGCWLLDSFRAKCPMEEALGVELKNEKVQLRATGALPLIKKWRPLCWFPEADNTWKSIRGLTESFMRATGIFCRIGPLRTPGGRCLRQSGGQSVGGRW